MTQQGRARIGWSALLVLSGAGWGLTQPLAKIAVSTGYQPFGIIFWQLIVGVILLGAINLTRGGRWPVHGKALQVYAAIALLGTVLPNTTSYTAVAHLPAGIMSIVIATVPMFAFPIALWLGIDRFSQGRFAGLFLGLVGVALIAVPQSSLPDRSLLVWLPVALFGPLCYALEGIFVAKNGTAGLSALEVLLGASSLGACLMLPLALGTGQFINPLIPFGAPEWSLLGLSALHALIYVAYVWMVGRTGAVFAAQVSYLVTGFGVLWAMLILNETYAFWVWAAMAAMLGGMALVSPHDPDGLASPNASVDTHP